MKLIRGYALAIVLGCTVTIFGFSSPVFLTPENLVNILDQVAIIGMIAVGMTLVIVTGGIDLSVGSMVAFTGIVLAKALVHGLSLPVSVLLCLVSGLSLGAINGFLISYGRLPAFIVTLGLMSTVRGASLYVTDGRAVSQLPPGVGSLLRTNVHGISVPVMLFFLLAIFAWVTMKFTYWGRFIYAIGGNERAAWLSGIATKRYRMLVYMVTGAICSVSGIVLVSKLNSAQPQAGNLYELTSIAAVVIGGASLSGGKGSVAGTLLGVLMLGVLQNGFSLLNVSSYYQQLLLGVILITAVYVDRNSLRGAMNA